MRLLKEMFSPWTWRMAWRDSRRDRKRLLLFSLSIVFGIAALVSIGSLRDNLQDTIDDQAKALLGADLMLTSRRPFDQKMEELIADIEGEQLEEISFTTMLAFPDSGGGSRLAQMRAFDHGFPYYGEVQNRTRRRLATTLRRKRRRPGKEPDGSVRCQCWRHCEDR